MGRDPLYYPSPGGGPPGGGPPGGPSPGGPRGGPTTQPSGVFPGAEPSFSGPPPPPPPPPSNQSGSETVTANTAPMSQPAMPTQPVQRFAMNSDTDYDSAIEGNSTDQEAGIPRSSADRFADPFDATPSRPSSSATEGVPWVEEDTRTEMQKMKQVVEDKMKSYRKTFEQTWNEQVLPVIKEVARTGVTQTIQVGKTSINITVDLANFVINHPIVHIGIFCGAATAGTFHVTNHKSAVAMRGVLESAVKFIPSFVRPELEEVNNEFDYWKMAMTVARGALEGGVLGTMTATFFQLLNKAVFGVGLYAKAEERIPERNVFQHTIQAGANATLALTNAATMGIVSEARARASTSRGQPAQLALQDRHAQLALQHWNAPGVAGMFPQTHIMMNQMQLANQSFAPQMQVMPYGVNPAALPPRSSYDFNEYRTEARFNPADHDLPTVARYSPGSYDFNEYPTEARYNPADHDMPTMARWSKRQGRGYGGPTEVDSIKGISAFSTMTPAQQALHTKPQLVVPRATKARAKGGAKTIKGLDPVLEFNETADDPYVMRQQVH